MATAAAASPMIQRIGIVLVVAFLFGFVGAAFLELGMRIEARIIAADR